MEEVNDFFNTIKETLAVKFSPDHFIVKSSNKNCLFNNFKIYFSYYHDVICVMFVCAKCFLTKSLSFSITNEDLG